MLREDSEAEFDRDNLVDICLDSEDEELFKFAKSF